MKIYLAARYRRFEEMQLYRHELQMMGHEVTARWINGDHRLDDAQVGSSEFREKAAIFAQDDLDDLYKADIVISFSEPIRTANRGGRHVEFGLGIAWNKRMMLVGNIENVFHNLPNVEIYADWPAAREAI